MTDEVKLGEMQKWQTAVILIIYIYILHLADALIQSDLQ